MYNGVQVLPTTKLHISRFCPSISCLTDVLRDVITRRGFHTNKSSLSSQDLEMEQIGSGGGTNPEGYVAKSTCGCFFCAMKSAGSTGGPSSSCL
jgi:hypothetical protein